MSKITYLIGDATSPAGEGTKLIAHVCNNYGGWGRGFVVALSKKWKAPEADYRTKDYKYDLGAARGVPVSKDIIVVNMVAQEGNSNRENPVAIRYNHLDTCLSTLKDFALDFNATVHMPRIGCGLGGGEWEKIEPLLVKNLCDNNIEVFVYDLTEKDRSRFL